MAQRTAVITGSTSGIGLAIAEAFAADGYRVVLNGFGERDAIERLTLRLRTDFGTEALYYPADLADGAQCAALIEAASSKFGSVDVLVNNAGIQFVAPAESFPAERWDAILAVNLSAAFHTTRFRAARDAATGLGTHSQHCVGAWPGCVGAESCLRGGEAWTWSG